MAESSVPPFKASLFYFFTAIAFVLGMFVYTSEPIRIFYAGFSSYLIFVAAVPLITNDPEKYQREVSVWVMGLMTLMMGTGVLMLAMDYSNTKSVLNPLIIGLVGGSLGAVLESRRAEWRKEVENL